MGISFQEFIRQNSLRQPEPENESATGTSGSEFYLSTSAPTSANEGSLWFNTNADDSRLYVLYDNNWIGIR